LPYADNFFEGWQSIGLAVQPQPNAGDANGIFYSPISLKATNQSRSTASDGYYRPIAQTRDNFHLLTRHEVTKINFDEHKRAVSVSVSMPMAKSSHI
jgi:choline dehydrogenase-like flavoprotein